MLSLNVPNLLTRGKPLSLGRRSAVRDLPVIPDSSRLNAGRMDLPHRHTRAFGGLLFILLAAIVTIGCGTGDPDAWTIERIPADSLSARNKTKLAFIRDSLEARTRRRDSLWNLSRRQRLKPTIDVRWTGDRPGVRTKTVRGDTLHWLSLDPYVINPGDSSIAVTHYEHLPLPVCRAFHRGRWLDTYDYESVRSIRTSSRLRPDDRFRFKYGGCSIPIEGPGTYLVLAEAHLFYDLSQQEQRIIKDAYTENEEQRAIITERRLRNTIPMFVASAPIIIQVGPS